MSRNGLITHERRAGLAFDPRVARHFYDGVGWLAQRFHVDVVGLEHVPRGRALLVANHAFGWDVMFPMEAVWRSLHRPVFALGEHVWWSVPLVRKLVAAIGTVDGTPANADLLLSHDELVLVLPGGLREAVKPRELRYHLMWGHRYGFVRAAIRNRAPLVPLACLGADEWFDFVGDAYQRGARWLKRPRLPLPLPSRLLPIPHLVRPRYVFGEPIDPPADPDAEHDPAAQRRLRREVAGALHELIEAELARRAGIEL